MKKVYSPPTNSEGTPDGHKVFVDTAGQVYLAEGGSMTKIEMINRMVALDICDLLDDAHNSEFDFFFSVLTGEGWKQYNNLTDRQVTAEYESREWDTMRDYRAARAADLYEKYIKEAA